MFRRQRTSKDLQKSTPKSELSVLENLFSHNGELSVLSILDLASYSMQINEYLSSNIIQNKDKNNNEPIIHRYLSKTQTYQK
jgi:hypothetical protein